jgi:hypothetical protein
MCLILSDEQQSRILEIAYAVNDKNLHEGTYYKYVGKNAAQRSFCIEMIALNKLYSKSDISIMSFQGVNGQFAKKGRHNYSIFKYAGGVNCMHGWQEVTLKKDKDGKMQQIDGEIVSQQMNPNASLSSDNHNNNIMENLTIYDWEFSEDDEKAVGVYAISLVQTPATDIYAMQFKSELEPQLFKLADEEKRILVSPILIPEQLIYRENINGKPAYVKASRETIAKIQENFVKRGFQASSNIEHDGVPIEGILFTEQWTVNDSLNDTINSYGFSDIPEGSWCVKAKLSQELWDDYIKTKKVRGFSIEGLLGLKKINSLNKLKMNRETINSIVAESIKQVALASDLPSFETKDGKKVYATDLAVDSVVTDEEGNPLVSASFEVDGNVYHTDDKGAIVNFEAVDPDKDVTIEAEIIKEDESKVAELEKTVSEQSITIQEQDAKIAELEAKLAEYNNNEVVMKAETVKLSAEIVALRNNKPAVAAIKDVPNSIAKDTPATGILDAFRKAKTI